MKLASLKSGRDGKLVVVSRDLKKMTEAVAIAPTLQAALDEWRLTAPQLEKLYDDLNIDSVQSTPFDPCQCAAPLPRAYQWVDGSAYLNHVELVRKARGAEMPESFLTDPLMYQGGSDYFLGPTDDIVLSDVSQGLDFEAEIVVITDDVPMGVSKYEALNHIKLLTLVNDISLRELVPAELEKGFGFFQSKPASSFSPVVLTPDELGSSWYEGRLHLPMQIHFNDKKFGVPNAGKDMHFHFGELIAHAAKTRHLMAGSIIGSGTISNKTSSEKGTRICEGGVGYACIAEQRMVEILEECQVRSRFMDIGDRIHIEILDKSGNTLFGAINQKVVTNEVV